MNWLARWEPMDADKRKSNALRSELGDRIGPRIHDALDDFAERRRRIRFLDEARKSFPCKTRLRLGVAVARRQDDAHLGPAQLQLPVGFFAAHIRHNQIE